ncbi:DUF1624 domain-containing protein [Sphingomonas montanisoli]|uniref:DUF1624 domain-containing protein n=1 Tax=Sphingomonas montanisoli TaxID=2606412 RepID=A0A5D9CC52_9SPHN|nr:heparan-alpha-glucosaminide N-acetyltransferase domain-containing protein [Sphingomonas montanisoli]TZG27701.1 DUF1624 domain-containing protein [Sphingomonas montanisoli]
MPVSPASASRSRIGSIDALRGLVMLLMLVDHTREFFFIHAQVSDPMDVEATAPSLFFTRLAAHLCAPVFVALTGLAAWLYAAPRGGAGAASGFLLKRGLFLVVLEWTAVNFAWTFDPTPPVIFLQVIWAIGLSMIALAGLVHLPRSALIAVGVIIVAGHNLLDPIAIAPGEPGHVIWSILHDRGLIDLPWGGQARTSYPLLPWIGVMALGYAVGPWFARAVAPALRRQRLMATGSVMLLGFVLLRSINIYGEPLPWAAGDTALLTTMSFVNLTKYPPSLDLLLLTLGIGTWLLVALEAMRGRLPTALAVFGSAPLFFYILHLYVLHALNRGVGMMLGRDGPVSVPSVGAIWLLAVMVALPCWFACRRFGAAKRASDAWWMRYL